MEAGGKLVVFCYQALKYEITRIICEGWGYIFAESLACDTPNNSSQFLPLIEFSLKSDYNKDITES